MNLKQTTGMTMLRDAT